MPWVAMSQHHGTGRYPRVEQGMKDGTCHRIDTLPIACNDDRAMREVIRSVVLMTVGVVVFGPVVDLTVDAM